jgi:hypothetical protein
VGLGNVVAWWDVQEPRITADHLMMNQFEYIAREITRLERRLHGYGEETPEGSLLPSRWTLAGSSLCWHVQFIEEVLEPDLDIEITSNALIVRAVSGRETVKVRLAILPIPGIFDVQNPEIRFESTSLEISLKWVKGDS